MVLSSKQRRHNCRHNNFMEERCCAGNRAWAFAGEKLYRFWISLCVGLFQQRLYPHVYPLCTPPLRVPLDECIAKRSFWKGLRAGFFYGPCTPPLDERFAKHVLLMGLCRGFVHGSCTPIRPLRVPLDECIAKRSFWKGLCAVASMAHVRPRLTNVSQNMHFGRVCVGVFVHGPCTPIGPPAGAA